MRKFNYILIGLFFLASCDLKTAEEYLNEADKLSEQNHNKEAIELLDKAIKKDPKYIGAYINRGADKSALGNFNDAILDYKTALNLDEGNTLALYNIGNNYKRLENYNAAIEYYDKALDSKGGQMLYMDNSQNELIHQDNFDVPGYEIFYERGIAFYNIDSLQKAYSDFNEAIKQNYMVPDSYYWLACIYIKQGQTDLACINFKKAIQLGDKDAINEARKYCE